MNDWPALDFERKRLTLDELKAKRWYLVVGEDGHEVLVKERPDAERWVTHCRGVIYKHKLTNWAWWTHEAKKSSPGLLHAGRH